MFKGFCIILPAAIMLAAAPNLSAQVYRCETSAGVIYSDMPCGETAEEIQLDVVEPATSISIESADSDLTAAVSNSTVESAGSSANEVQTLSDFSRMLESQRETQINEIDRTLSRLKAQVASDSFEASDEETKSQLLAQIAELQDSRESILVQYEAMIAEAERRTQ